MPSKLISNLPSLISVCLPSQTGRVGVSVAGGVVIVVTDGALEATIGARVVGERVRIDRLGLGVKRLGAILGCVVPRGFCRVAVAFRFGRTTEKRRTTKTTPAATETTPPKTKTHFRFTNRRRLRIRLSVIRTEACVMLWT